MAESAEWCTATHSVDETRALGERLGRLLSPGSVVLLSGDLGAGKTVLAQGIGRGLDTPTPVRSSSFVILSEHRGGRLPLLHADLYRISAMEEIDELALEEEAMGGVLLVEWAERWSGHGPPDHLAVRFDAGPAECDRAITFRAAGPAHAALLQRIRAGAAAEVAGHDGR